MNSDNSSILEKAKEFLNTQDVEQFSAALEQDARRFNKAFEDEEEARLT